MGNEMTKDEIQAAELGSNICWSNGKDVCTQVEDEYDELCIRIRNLLSGGQIE